LRNAQKLLRNILTRVSAPGDPVEENLTSPRRVMRWRMDNNDAPQVFRSFVTVIP